MKKFTEDVLDIIQSIPYGNVMTYGQIAAVAGNLHGARQVSRILHSMSDKYNLPWHRVINAQGKISLKGEYGHLQKRLLEQEGIVFKNHKINLREYRFKFN
ncbi:MAG: MGMT family protein [Candidatus Izimaplasma sp.]|nr:MGMT family protein [Candidatus Izimaplasma bacterium]